MKVIPMDLHTLLSGLPSLDDAQNEHPLPLYEAQVVELRKIAQQFSKAQTRPEFEFGDFVAYNHKVGSLLDELRERKVALMFWRMLNPNDPVDKRRMELLDPEALRFYPDPDCLVLITTGTAAQFHISQTGFLTKVEPTSHQ